MIFFNLVEKKKTVYVTDRLSGRCYSIKKKKKIVFCAEPFCVETPDRVHWRRLRFPSSGVSAMEFRLHESCFYNIIIIILFQINNDKVSMYKYILCYYFRPAAILWHRPEKITRGGEIIFSLQSNPRGVV